MRGFRGASLTILRRFDRCARSGARRVGSRGLPPGGCRGLCGRDKIRAVGADQFGERGQGSQAESLGTDHLGAVSGVLGPARWCGVPWPSQGGVVTHGVVRPVVAAAQSNNSLPPWSRARPRRFDERATHPADTVILGNRGHNPARATDDPVVAVSPPSDSSYPLN